MVGLVSLLAAVISIAGMPLSTQTEVTGSLELTVKTNETTYFRGSLSSDRPLEGVVVLNQQGEIVKILLGKGEQESDIYWLATESAQYKIQIRSLPGQTANVTLNLRQLPLKKNQNIAPSLPLISPLLEHTQQAINNGHKDAEDKFWEYVSEQGTPLIEPTEEGMQLLTFLWQGDESNVRVLGSPYEGHAHLARLPQSNIWYKSYVVPADTRLSYQLAPNVPQIITEGVAESRTEQRRAVLATSQVDPLNHNPPFAKDDHRFGASSTVSLRDAPDDSVTHNLGNPQGQLHHHTYFSKMLGNTRRITVYVPNKKYPLTPQSPLLLLFDGDAYLGQVPTPRILDNLIASGEIPPLHAVFINNPLPSLRSAELTPNDQFADFMAQEFKPYLCSRYDICPRAQETILSGSSFGGLASMSIAFRHPEAFGAVLSQSGSFWWHQENEGNLWMMDQVANAEPKKLNIYLNAGLFESAGEDSILDTNRLLYTELKNKGYPVVFQQVSGGHDYFAWRVMLAHGLIQLFKNKEKGSYNQ